MIAKKTDKGNLENKRGLFLLVGFAVVLGLIYAGFELFANEDKAPAFELQDDEFITVVDDDVIATDQTPPPPPEPQQQQQEVVLNIVEDNIFYAHHIVGSAPEWMDCACARLTDEVYLTIDLDGLDPSVLPATGTPLPGGLSWYELTRFIDKVAKNRRIVGFDVVELCPQADSKVSDVLAATLVYKMLTLWEMFG